MSWVWIEPPVPAQTRGESGRVERKLGYSDGRHLGECFRQRSANDNKCIEFSNERNAAEQRNGVFDLPLLTAGRQPGVEEAGVVAG